MTWLIKLNNGHNFSDKVLLYSITINDQEYLLKVIKHNEGTPYPFN